MVLDDDSVSQDSKLAKAGRSKADHLMDFMLRPAHESSNSVVTLQPIPDFVVKSKLVSTEGRPSHLLKLEANSKIFINICHHDEVPKPDIEFDSSVVYPLIMNNQWEVPIVTSSVREDRDKKGALCYVWDCCINSKCMDWISEDLQLREIVIEWCLESCELSDVVGISRENMAFPKMKKKGDEIPVLEVHSSELTNNYQENIAKAMETENDGPSNIIKMRRSLLDDDSRSNLGGADDDELPPLLPSTRPSDKPLIEEIDNLKIADLQVKKPLATVNLPELQFDVSIRKTTDTKSFKLRIEVSSQIESASDLMLIYIPQDNALEIKNLNLHVYKEKTLHIPLPNIFSEADLSRMQSFFVKRDNKMIIFV